MTSQQQQQQLWVFHNKRNAQQLQSVASATCQSSTHDQARQNYWRENESFSFGSNENVRKKEKRRDKE